MKRKKVQATELNAVLQARYITREKQQMSTSGKQVKFI